MPNFPEQTRASGTPRSANCPMPARRVFAASCCRSPSCCRSRSRSTVRSRTSPAGAAAQPLLPRDARQVGAAGHALRLRAAVRGREHLTLHCSDRLSTIRSQLFATLPDQFSPKDRMAWAINVYNFPVVEHATIHMLVPNRQFLRYKSVNDIVVEGTSFFVLPWSSLEGRIVVHRGVRAPLRLRRQHAAARSPGAMGGDLRLSFAFVWLRWRLCRCAARVHGRLRSAAQ